jgi:hypothetical protein
MNAQAEQLLQFVEEMLRLIKGTAGSQGKFINPGEPLDAVAATKARLQPVPDRQVVVKKSSIDPAKPFPGGTSRKEIPPGGPSANDWGDSDDF